MGNHIVCCRQKWSQLQDSEEKIPTHISESKVSYNNPAATFSGDVWRTCSTAHLFEAHDSDEFLDSHLRINSVGVTQHIRDREPEDTEFDPSLNASRCALFISGFTQRSVHQSDESEQLKQIPTTPGPTCKHRDYLSSSPQLKRWSSCSTIYIGDSCLVHPNQKSTLWSVSIAVGLLVRSEKNQRLSAPVSSPPIGHLVKTSKYNFSFCIYEDVYSLFDERRHSLDRYPSDGSAACIQPDMTQNPKATDVHQFLSRLFNTALIGPECAIVALIFLERLVNAAEVGILPWSWRRQLLACILLSSKILDDQAVWNTDYCQILRDVCVDDLNALERHTLSLLQFNIDVPPAVYARYYFDLLYVVQASGVANQPAERRRLTAELAEQLRLLPPRSNDLSTSNAGFLFDLPRVDPLHVKPHRDPDPHLINIKKRPQNHRTVSSAKSKPLPPTVDDSGRPSCSLLNPGFNGAKAGCSVIVSTTSIPRGEDNAAQSTIDPFADSAIVYTLEPIPPAQSCSEDEGPLQLDDETDLINTITTSLVASPLTEVFPTSLIPDPLRDGNSSQTLSNVWNSLQPSAISHTMDTSNIISSHRTNVRSQACDSSRIGPNDSASTSSGFIRTLMGGDVAYSLLRDAGMY